MDNRLLFQKGKIGNVEIKNRIIMAPMGVKSEGDGGASPRETDFYVERAKGGVGMIITGRYASTDKYEMRSNHILSEFGQVGRLGLMTEKIHQYDTKLCLQIGCGLGRIVYMDPFTPPFSASEVPSFHFPNLICRPYTVEQIKELNFSMGWTAYLARVANCDAVELHAYGGYLYDQFMSTLWNKREDEYGGSLENRMRFLMETIEEIQKQAGKDFPIIVKYTPYHGWPGGREIEEGIEIAKMLEAKGVAALHIDKGCYEHWYVQIPTVYSDDACQIDVATEIKKNVNIPVIAHGKLRKPDVAERVLQEGRCDFVGVAHQFLTDPEYPNKVKEGKYYDIRPCIGCNECIHVSHVGHDYSCAVNPRCLRETDYPVLEAKDKKNVLVIGGGPGGLACAITAKQRGHNVQLWEKRNILGGALVAAGAPSFKKDVKEYTDYLIRKAYREGIDIRLNAEANVDKIVEAGFDKVVLAMGGKPIVPPVEGIKESDKVTFAKSVLEAQADHTGKSVVVIGGGDVGCETAVSVAQTADKVAIVEMKPDILFEANHNKNNDQHLRRLVADAEIDLFVNATVSKITEEGLEYVIDGQTKTLKCDEIVLAAGFKADRTLEYALEEKELDFATIGDVKRGAGKVWDAVHEGFYVARLI